MFVDRVKLHLKAGGGGDGCCSFRREKYVPHGGPDGGDGGGGGAIYLVADAQLHSLLDLKYRPHWKGNRGVHGQGSGCHGRRGEDVRIRVPVGTVVRRWPDGEVAVDLTHEGQEFLAAQGGRGGRGNARFATSTNRVPRFCEVGEPGEEVEYLLELKLIAEVGIVGLPNAGKSTLLSVITSAHPKIASYPFTTIDPNLGVAELPGHRTLTIADIPGIIEGAAQGKGLGHDFLRHIERTRVLLFVIDASDSDPESILDILEHELAEHSPVFEDRPRVIALSKADLPGNRERYDAFAKKYPGAHFISGVTREGLDGLLEELWTIVDRLRRELPIEEPVEETEYAYEAPFTIDKIPSGYRVEGKNLLRIIRMTDFTNDEAVHHMQKRLERAGLFKALHRMGAQEGQSIWIGDVELEYHPN